MGILLWIVFGFVVGLLARAILPGEQHMGIVWTTLLGIAGSLAGGLVVSALTGRPLLQFHTIGIIGSIVAAIILLWIADALFKRRHRPATP